jgi:hypothetical protein
MGLLSKVALLRSNEQTEKNAPVSSECNSGELHSAEYYSAEYYSEESSPVEAISGEINSAEQNSVKEKITQFHLSYNESNCVVFSGPDENDKEVFLARVTNIMRNTGAVIPLSNGNPLILLPGTMDRELIAHRLSKNLNTLPLFSFEANSSENVISRLASIL